MKKYLGFTSFEFYFVMSVIGIIMLVGLQRYLQLAEETKRFSFEVMAQHFNASIYNLRAKWMLSLQQADHKDILDSEGRAIQFSHEGWPMAEAGATADVAKINVVDCYFLWQTLQQNPAPISFEGGDPYGSRAYHLRVTPAKNCRFELVTDTPEEYFFDYSPKTGQVIIHTPPISKK